MKKLYLLLAILVQVSVVFSQHFVKGYTSVNPYDPMNIVIKSAKIDGVSLEIGDEIAVFDGNLCCGVWVVDQPIEIPLPSVQASTEYPVGAQNGFKSGNTMYFRFWDNSANKEYHNIVATVLDDTDTPIPNVFASNGTAFVQLANDNTSLTTRTWTGALGFGLWTLTANWAENKLPEPNSIVTIPNTAVKPIIFNNTTAYCGSLTLAFGSSLTIQSDASGTGSLIVANGITGTAAVSSQRYMSGAAWHLISSPLTVQTKASFLSLPANSVISTNGASRGMMDYSESLDNWNAFFQNTDGGNISPGQGFCIRTDADNFVTFSGSLTNGTVNSAILKANNGWNLIGNPYTSAIYARQEAVGFLKVNETELDPSYVAIYLWDEGSSAYTIINSGAGQTNLASGQGFFVKAKTGGGNVSFKQTMQVHQIDATFKSAIIDAPNVVLKAKAGNIYSSTKINFNEEMTLGLDPSYDAGILRSGKGFDIYSKLVTDNGVDFAIQWLPGNSADSYIIPVGVDASNGGEIVFSAEMMNLPVGYDVKLEDKLTNTLTDIKNGELYVTDLAAGSKGVGRFYLHVGSSVQTGLTQIQKDDISVYTIDQNLYIKGNVSRDAQFMVYSIDGRLINRFGAVSQNLNQLSVAGYTPGIYFVKVLDSNKYKPVKFVVEK